MVIFHIYIYIYVSHYQMVPDMGCTTIPNSVDIEARWFPRNAPAPCDLRPLRRTTWMMNPRCGRGARGFQGGIPKARMAMGNPLHTEVTLWWTNILPWKITIFNGKIHYFYGHFQLLFVGSPEGMRLVWMGKSSANDGFVPKVWMVYDGKSYYNMI